MTTRIVVDASVAIKWIVPEQDTEAARDVVARHEPIAPQLIYAECTNILWKKVGRSEMTSEQAFAALDLIETYGIETSSMQALASTALDLSFALDHPAYDCFYVALSFIEECDFITADDKLYRKVQARLAPHLARRCRLLGGKAS